MKIYIQTDIEGVAGVVHFENSQDKSAKAALHWQRMRQLLTEEVKAAIDGARDAGATEILVNDSHGSGYNILVEQLAPDVRVIQGRLDRLPFWLPLLDGAFDAVVGVGMHPMAGTKHGILPHTQWDCNGVLLPEMGMTCAIAGYYGVPAVFASGDRALCEQVLRLVPEMETAAVKDAFSPYTAVTCTPAKAQEMIRAGVAHGIRRRRQIPPFRIPGPYRMTIVGREGDQPVGPCAGDDFIQVVRDVLKLIGYRHGDQTLDDYQYP